MANVSKKEYHAQWRAKNQDKIKAYIKKHRENSVKNLKIWRHDNPAKCLHLNIKSRAKRTGIEFNISWQDIDIPVICPVLGIPIMMGTHEGMKTGPTINSPSVDRIDNTKGYIKGNIQVISHKANTMKNSATPEQLLRFANWVIHTYGDKNERT